MDKTTTFADLGIPFRLFEAPVECCSDFIGRGACSVCEQKEQWVFSAGIGDDLIVACPSCGEANGLRCDDKDDVLCVRCALPVVWPLARAEVHVCYECLRAGRVHFTQDTVLGMVRWEDAERGWTHGVPGPLGSAEKEFASRPKDDEPDWHEISLNLDDARELGRTPSYVSWQGERWPFHCGRVMIYIGEPLTRPQSESSPEVVSAVGAIVEREDWDLDSNDVWNSSQCVYLFRCQLCGVFDGHADCD